ncbi:hypothetical protein D3A96_06000 [Robertkochia marina]|nr:hypothetical protein D3A96_06000 [Robertkochia marina]
MLSGRSENKKAGRATAWVRLFCNDPLQDHGPDEGRDVNPVSEKRQKPDCPQTGLLSGRSENKKAGRATAWVRLFCNNSYRITVLTKEGT